MQTAKVLAEAVIPNEYGIDPAQKLRIGSKICSALLGKLLADLANMRDESLATAVSCCPSPAVLHLPVLSCLTKAVVPGCLSSHCCKLLSHTWSAMVSLPQS